MMNRFLSWRLFPALLLIVLSLAAMPAEEVEKRNQSTLGFTALAAVGAGRGRLHAEGRVQMSFYPAESVESYRDISSGLIGTRRAVFGAVGVGFRL